MAAPPLPAAGAERAAGASGEPAPREPAGTRAGTPAPHPQPPSLRSPLPGGASPSAHSRPASVPLPPGCPRRSRGASSCCCRISRAGAAAAGRRAGGLPGAAAAGDSRVPTPAPRCPTPLPGLGGCDNGL